MKLLWEINRDFDLNMNLVTYMRLGTACTQFNQSMMRNRNSNGTVLKLWDFLSGFKKGSKQIRRVISKAQVKKKPFTERTHVKTFFRLIGEQIPVSEQYRYIFSDWVVNYLTNSTREFIFKFCSNILGINVRLSHFVDEFSRNCTFCHLSVPRIAADETFIHIFFSCPVTANYLRKFEREFFPEIMFPTNSANKQFWFLHMPPLNYRALNIFHRTALWLFKYVIWVAKLKKKIPSYLTMKIDFFYLLRSAVNLNASLKTASFNDSFTISRNWLLLERGHL